MHVISKDSESGFLVTLGSPMRPESQIKFRASGEFAKMETDIWIKRSRISQNHFIDLTGNGFVLDEWTEWFQGIARGADL